MPEPIPDLAPGVPELAPTIEKVKGEYILTCRSRMPRPRSEIFPFFADARNLQKLTPSNVQFKILTEGEIEMKEGTLIDYRIKIRGIPIRWRTEITAWEPPDRFADVQLKGPYRQWIHEHVFVDEGPTTLVQDRVRYKVLGGGLIHWLAVKRDVVKIFTYRDEMMAKLFPPL